jgi:hypothetical protein
LFSLQKFAKIKNMSTSENINGIKNMNITNKIKFEKSLQTLFSF